MRLGDLDVLYDCVEARYRQSSGEEHRTERALLDAICDSPTIPAIPVEWLKAQIYEMIDDNETELASDIDWLIRKYMNEQEEQEEAR